MEEKRKENFMKKSLSLKVLVLVIFIVLAASAMAAAETLVFNDDFTAGLGNWQPGCNTALHTAPTLAVEGGKVVWHQGWDYIESNQAFSGNFRVEVDIERSNSSPQCKDFSLELVNAPAFAGAFRFQYGTYRKDSVLLGQAPKYNTISSFEHLGECIHHSTSSYLREMDTVAGVPHTGTISLTYNNGQLTMAYKNSLGQTIQTPAAAVGNLGATKIRIAAVSGSPNGSGDYVNAVRVYSLDNAAAGDCTTIDLNNLNLNIPCLMIGGHKYRMRLLYDPSVQGGYYWKLDLTSLQEAQ